MTMRRKIAAGLGGLTLMLGTLGGAAAVGAANNHPATPVGTVQSGQSDGETADGPDATNGQDTPEPGDTPDATGTATGPDTDNVQDGSGQEGEDDGPDMPVTTTP